MAGVIHANKGLSLNVDFVIFSQQKFDSKINLFHTKFSCYSPPWTCHHISFLKLTLHVWMDIIIRQKFGEGSFPSKVTFHVYLCSTWSCSLSTKTFFHLSAFFLPACLCFTAAWKSSHRGSLRPWCWIRKWISHSSYGLHGKKKFHHWQNASLGEWPSYNFCFVSFVFSHKSLSSFWHACINL